MKLTIKTIYLGMAVLGLASCKKADMNIDPDNLTATLINMTYIQDGETSIKSGLQYFGNGALTYPATDIADTAIYQVSIAGANTLSQDVTVTVGQDLKALNDNFKTDSITYQAMPDSLFHFINTTGVIKAGTRVASFKVIFYPYKVDITKNFMLAITATNSANVATSSNFGHLYFHTIGNPLAGAYSWDFLRYNSADASTPPTAQSFSGSSTKFIPINPTSFNVPTGYYTQPNYTVKFKNVAGVLSNFSASFDASVIKDVFTANGIALTDGPYINVSSDYKTITITYQVQNSSGFRYLVDKYYR